MEKARLHKISDEKDMFLRLSAARKVREDMQRHVDSLKRLPEGSEELRSEPKLF